MQAFQGYFDQGQFITQGSVIIPERKRAIVTILDESIPDDICVTRQRSALAWLKENIQSCSEPVPEFERVTLREIEV